ncbi:FAD-dependent oxidoreductase [Helicobacter baculiformis]|uniref:FAD-dependent oxidoreductase n=1 Tax=Helicobacter baculiformis TaxID=427351 RepID=A0ABV7ZH38_9HELI|nr:FAD-dependent oxidoreductase [Helicobacter baculiformis]
MNLDYDLIVIGFGKAGKTLATEASKLGKKVALIEQSKEMYGGTCINIGCLPSKALLHLATHKKGTLGYKESIEEKNKMVSFLRQKNYDMVTRAGVQVVEGRASFKDPHTLMVYHKDSCKEMSAHKIVINTGSLPAQPPIPIQSDRVYDSTTLMQLNTLPSHLVVVGGGYIGLEFASMFNLFGRVGQKSITQVSVLMRGDTFLPKEDLAFQASILESLTKQGIEMVFNSNLQSIVDQQVYYQNTQTGQQTYLEADAILLATGRVPNTAGLQLEKAGVRLGKSKEILTNEYLVANADHEGNIYALGDVKGGEMFTTYVSLDDFRIAFQHLYGNQSRSTKNRNVLPEVLYVETPYSHVGMRAKDIERSGKKVLVKTLESASIAGTRVVEDTTGILQVLVEDNAQQTILGASLHCALSYEIINLFSLAINQRLGFEALKDMIYTHPSITEGFNLL